jgi:hypothetical protein
LKRSDEENVAGDLCILFKFGRKPIAKHRPHADAAGEENETDGAQPRGCYRQRRPSPVSGSA